jgi:hypothetical protein
MFVEGLDNFLPNSLRCIGYMNEVVPTIVAGTDKQFAFYESNGVSQELRRAYYSLPDDPKWYDRNNLFRKPDLEMSAEEAFHYYLVTQLESPLVAIATPNVVH